MYRSIAMRSTVSSSTRRMATVSAPLSWSCTIAWPRSRVPCRSGELAERPIEVHRLDDLDELGEVDGFDDVPRDPEVIALDDVRLFLGGCRDDDGNPFEML